MRGGFDTIPGPLWADRRELTNDWLQSIHQVVGHTPVKECISVFDDSTGIHFIDCLEHGVFKSVVVVQIENDKYNNHSVIEN
jgi:hypothetical protein